MCLNLSDILSTQPDRKGSSITFTMRNGNVWRNELHKDCPDLGFNGFEWVSQGGRVCEDEQMIRVLHSGEICRLGRFVAVPAAPKP